jgi:integrase
LFCSPKGKPINTYRKGFQTLCDKLGILYDNRGRKRTIYSLRHFYSIMRLEKGVNVFLLSKQLGNSIAVLEKHYGDIVVKLMSEQITQMGDKNETNVNAKTLPWD